MSYNDLTTMKLIGNIPADINFEAKAIQNDSYLKTTQDLEDLTSVKADILPNVTNTRTIGSKDLTFYNGWFSNICTQLLFIDDATINKINNELNFSLASGQSFITPLILGTSAAKLYAANETQLQINNTIDSSSWAIGTVNQSLVFKNLTSQIQQISFSDILADFKLPLSITSDATIFEVGATNKSGVSITGSLGLTSTSLTPTLSISVLDKTKFLIDTTTQDVVLSNFTNPKEGQIIYIIKKVKENTLTITHDEVTGVLLKGCVNYVIAANSFGGIVLSYDEGAWREISRS